LSTECLKLSLVCVDPPRVLIIENTNLISENFHSLLELGEISSDRLRTTLLASVDLVNTGGNGDGPAHRKNDRKPQSYLTTAHVIVSGNLAHYGDNITAGGPRLEETRLRYSSIVSDVGSIGKDQLA
jgi:hypothetical protein